MDKLTTRIRPVVVLGDEAEHGLGPNKVQPYGISMISDLYAALTDAQLKA